MIKVYADTSVFGGVFDIDFCNPSRQFFDQVQVGDFLLVTSAIVEAEIEAAPKKIQDFFISATKKAQIAIIKPEIIDLQESYIQSGVVTKKSHQDALHVAIATVSECDLIVSWNFKHIVHFDKVPKYNAVNILNGYKNLGIHSPLEVINHES